MRWLTGSVLAVLLLGLTSCGAKPPPRLRTPAEIEAARRQVPTMYLTGKSQKKVMAPINAGLFVDKDTGEICWPAYYCTNPQCPGKALGTDGDPFVFAHVDPFVEVGPDGQFRRIEIADYKNVYNEMRKRGGFGEPTCPKCLDIRSPASIDATNKSANRQAYQERVSYRAWIKPYYPPETQRHFAELDNEQSKWDVYVAERKKMPNKIQAEDQN